MPTRTDVTISVTPGYIGQKTSADKSNILSYSITTDGMMRTITEKINGVTIATRTNPTNGQQFTVSLSQAQWDAIKFGTATLTIEMDGEVWTYTFDKRLNVNDDILSAVKGVQDLQAHLNGIKAQLAAAIRAKGGTVNDTDAWSAFVSAVTNMTNKRWATGTRGWSTTDSNQVSYTISGLSFTPSIVFVIRDTPPYSSSWYGTGVRFGDYFVGCPSSGTGSGGQAGVYAIDITGTSFIVRIVGSSGYNLSGTFTWYAFE